MGYSVVADYKVVRIPPVRLRVGGDTDRTFGFVLPDKTETGVNSPKVVSFLLISSDDLDMRITIDDTIVSSRQYANGPERCIQEIVTGVSSAVEKTMTFTVLRGEAYFSDVVLWFQRRTTEGSTGGIVADYKAVKIKPVRLRVGGDTDRTFEFFLPSAITAAPGLPMIVTYLLVSSNNLRLTTSIDGITVSDRRYTNAPERCIQDVVTGIPATVEKTMTFTALSGEAYFSDVALWFQCAAHFEEVIG